MKVVNICSVRYDKLTFQWEDAYLHVIKAFRELGYTVRVCPKLEMKNMPDYVQVGLEHGDDAIYVYNHTYMQEIKELGLPTGKLALFVKPTAPAPNYFTIDKLGYAASSEITYNKPDFESVDTDKFFNTTVKELKSNREHKWSRTKEVTFTPLSNVPEDHILILGQMIGDETVTKFSFGNHWVKLQNIVERLKHRDNVVLKLHPTFKSKMGNLPQWDSLYAIINKWKQEGITVYEDYESLYDILPHTNVAILENSTAGIECLMHEVPIISYGYPEFHWVTKDLRHLNMLNSYIDDISWWDLDMSKKWLAWYSTKYQCHNYSSTFNRVEDLCSEI